MLCVKSYEIPRQEKVDKYLANMISIEELLYGNGISMRVENGTLNTNTNIHTNRNENIKITNEKKQQYIIFRGTANVKNLLSAIRCDLKYDCDLDMNFHEGYANASKFIARKIFPYIDPTATLHFTGYFFVYFFLCSNFFFFFFCDFQFHNFSIFFFFARMYKKPQNFC